ncbi:MAG: hypothetical protein ACYDEF_09505 [Methanosarcina sp.]
MKKLEPYFEMAATLKINDIEFTLRKVEELSGSLAVWYNEDFVIRATPCFDNVAVSVEVLQHGYEPLDDEWHSIGEDCYNVEVYSFERYCEIVKVLAEKIFRRCNRG